MKRELNWLYFCDNSDLLTQYNLSFCFVFWLIGILYFGWYMRWIWEFLVVKDKHRCNKGMSDAGKSLHNNACVWRFHQELGDSWLIPRNLSVWAILEVFWMEWEFPCFWTVNEMGWIWIHHSSLDWSRCMVMNQAIFAPSIANIICKSPWIASAQRLKVVNIRFVSSFPFFCLAHSSTLLSLPSSLISFLGCQSCVVKQIPRLSSRTNGLRLREHAVMETEDVFSAKVQWGSR